MDGETKFTTTTQTQIKHVAAQLSKCNFGAPNEKQTYGSDLGPVLLFPVELI